MDLPRNRFKAAIGAMQPQVGLWCTIDDTQVTEMVAGAGFDWLMFDIEHTGLDENSVLRHLQAAAPSGVSTMVRPRSLDPAEIKKLLDLGVQTLLIPYVQTPEEAALAAASVTYPPEGIRGVAAGSRASGFGRIADYAARARDEICLLVQVETAATLPQIEAIAAVPGVDGMFVGPADLAASMGHPGNPRHPEVRAAIVDAISRIRAAGKPPGFLSLDPELMAAAREAGAVFTCPMIDKAALMQGLAGVLPDRGALGA